MDPNRTDIGPYSPSASYPLNGNHNDEVWSSIMPIKCDVISTIQLCKERENVINTILIEKFIDNIA